MADVERITGNAVLRREWRRLAQFVVESFVAGLVVSIVLALAVFIVSTPARAAPAADGTGTLYLTDAGGGRSSTPRKKARRW